MPSELQNLLITGKNSLTEDEGRGPERTSDLPQATQLENEPGLESRA